MNLFVIKDKETAFIQSEKLILYLGTNVCNYGRW